MIIVTGQTRSGTRLDIRLPTVCDETLEHAVRCGLARCPGPWPDEPHFPSAAQVQVAGTLASRALRVRCQAAQAQGGWSWGGVAFHRVDRVEFSAEAVLALLNVSISTADG